MTAATAHRGDSVFIKLTPARETAQKKNTLEQLFADWDGEYEVDEELAEWERMKPVGRENL